MKQSVTCKLGKKLISHERVWQLFGPQATLDEIRNAASRICRDYLNGRWKVVSADQLIVKRISGGLSNFLYYVSLPQDNTNDAPNYKSAAQAIETTLDRATALLTAVDVENRNEPRYNELLAAVSDLNGNKRKRYDSVSSASSAIRQNEPQEVLLRIYGQSHGEDALEGMITESVVFALLSERHFGPKLHGIFPGGRIEQYIPARALQTTELSDSKISIKIAEKMGEIHSLNIPMSKEPDWIWNCMNRWQRNLPAILNRNDWKENQKHADFIKNINYEEEAKWLKAVIDHGQYPVQFCHNDLQEGNILLRNYHNSENSNLDDSVMSANNGDRGDMLNNKQCKTLDLDSFTDSTLCSDKSSLEPDLMIIDFEYCAYNYRGFDLANHFLEWTFDYSNPQFPFYYHRKQHFPTQEQRQRFIKSYLKRLNEAGDDWEPTQQEIDDVENEVKLFKMFSHLFWSLWSVVNVTSNIEFGYWDYAITRINEYLQLKQNFLKDKTLNV